MSDGRALEPERSAGVRVPQLARELIAAGFRGAADAARLADAGNVALALGYAPGVLYVQAVRAWRHHLAHPAGVKWLRVVEAIETLIRMDLAGPGSQSGTGDPGDAG